MPPMSFKGFADHNTEAAETAETAQLYKLDGRPMDPPCSHRNLIPKCAPLAFGFGPLSQLRVSRSMPHGT